MGHERDQDRWLGTTLRQSPAAATDGCPDGETLAAWAEGALRAKAAAAVDLHASNCSRCTAVLAAMERTAPAAAARHAWTPARLFRWLVPLTAAATAVAIWIAVPDRSITPEQAAAVQDRRATSDRMDAAAKPDTDTAASGQVPVPVPVPVPEARTLKRNPAPGTQNAEPRALQRSDELRRERAAPEAFKAPDVADAPPLTSSAAAPTAAAPAPPAAPAPIAQPSVSTDTLAGAAAGSAQRSALNKTTITSESASAENPRIRWRVVNSASIERSTDGGNTWMKTTPPPGVAPNNTPAVTVVVLRAVDGSRAVVRISDGTQFYTTNGGVSWTRVQENSAVPF
jgi:hypothetical protein